MELSELSSIKPRQIKLLMENGITDIRALSMSVPRDLEDIEGISSKSSKKLIWDARDVGNVNIQTSFRDRREL